MIASSYDFTDPRLFPPDGNAILWELLGWNDTTATINAILISRRQVNTRIAKFLTYLEEALNTKQVGTAYGNGVGCLCPNLWYVFGIEEAMLYVEENRASLSTRNLMLPGQHYVHAEPHTPYYPTCCCRCNEPLESGFYCNVLVLDNDIVCSLNCAKLLLDSRIESDLWLRHSFGSGVLHRLNCPIPEEPTALRHHLQSIPWKDAFGSDDAKPPVPEITFAKPVHPTILRSMEMLHEIEKINTAVAQSLHRPTGQQEVDAG